MDPISIITTVVAVVGALGTIHGMIEDYRKRHKERGNISGDDGKEQLNAALELSQAVNILSSRLGRTLPDEIDKKLNSDLLALQEEVQALLKYLDALKASSKPHKAQLAAADDEELFADWKKKAMILKDKAQRAVDKFSSRLDQKTPDNVQDGNVSPLKDRGLIHRRFCYGAILCQHGTAKTASISVSTDNRPRRWGFICKYCNQEVGDYTTLRLKSSGTPLEMSDLLASCHLMVCGSQDLRAFYRCLACHLKQKLVDFPTALELEKHMDQHPDFSFLPKPLQSAGEKAAAKNIKDFLNRDVAAPIKPTTETQQQAEVSDQGSMSDSSERLVTLSDDEEVPREEALPTPLGSPKPFAIPPLQVPRLPQVTKYQPPQSNSISRQSRTNAQELPANITQFRYELDGHSKGNHYELSGSEVQLPSVVNEHKTTSYERAVAHSRSSQPQNQGGFENRQRSGDLPTETNRQVARPMSRASSHPRLDQGSSSGYKRQRNGNEVGEGKNVAEKSWK